MNVCAKVSYCSNAEAKTAKRHCLRAAAGGVSWRNETRVYRCPLPDCGAWHLTSQPHNDYPESENA